MNTNPQLVNAARYMRLLEKNPEAVTLLETVYQRSRENDPELMRLPHPARWRWASQDRMMETLIPQVAWTDLLRLIEDATLTNAELSTQWLESHPDALWFHGDVNTGDGFIRRGALDTTMTPLLHHLRQGRDFQIDDRLLAGLRLTDIGREAPTSWFRLPYSDVFIEFGAKRDLPLSVHHRASGAHRLEGVYIHEAQSDRAWDAHPDIVRKLGLDLSRPRRVLNFLFIGSPLEHNGVLDDASLTFALILQETQESRPLMEVLEEQLNAYIELAQKNAAQGNSSFDVIEHNDIVLAMDLLAKCVLYLNTNSVRLELREERKALEDRLSKVKSGKKRAKLERRVARAYDHVLVTADWGADTASTKGERARGPVRAHWRRGHFRHQRYGPGRKKTRLTWIQPVLVNPGTLPGPPTAKPYKVK